MNPTHDPVMLQTITEQLCSPARPQPQTHHGLPSTGGGSAEPAAAALRLVDGTLGLGGHAEALLSRLAPEGRLVGLDRDGQMLIHAERRLAPFGERFTAVRARIAFIADVVRGLGLDPVDGVLLDLGLCSAQLDAPERGFSFRADAAPLDMRMNQAHGETAAELLERVELDDLVRILRDGDVPAAGRVARLLLAERPIRSVGQLRELLRGVRLPKRRHHFATLVFQALRLEVNRELLDLEGALDGALSILRPGGRLAVLSYHSGEDRRVKQFLAREARGCICPPSLPQCGCGRTARMRVLVRGAAPDAEEVRTNPRARSARLRVGERL